MTILGCRNALETVKLSIRLLQDVDLNLSHFCATIFEERENEKGRKFTLQLSNSLQCETNAYGEANYARYVPILRHKTSSNVLVSQKTKLTSDNTLVFLRGLQK